MLPVPALARHVRSPQHQRHPEGDVSEEGPPSRVWLPSRRGSLGVTDGGKIRLTADRGSTPRRRLAVPTTGSSAERTRRTTGRSVAWLQLGRETERVGTSTESASPPSSLRQVARDDSPGSGPSPVAATGRQAGCGPARGHPRDDLGQRIHAKPLPARELSHASYVVNMVERDRVGARSLNHGAPAGTDPGDGRRRRQQFPVAVRGPGNG